MLPGVRKRSRLYARLHAGVPDALALRSAARPRRAAVHLQGRPARGAGRGSDDEPFGANQAAAQADIVQAISSSGTTGRPLYYALTARDVETIGDAVANVWFTAGIRKDDVVAHLVGLPMVAGGLPYADGFRRIGATLCWLGGFPTERILREMRTCASPRCSPTTSFALHLSEQWDAVGRETGIARSCAR
jgi:phenylacetate-CoA ligase/benzoylacetate-CoA ligase